VTKNRLLWHHYWHSKITHREAKCFSSSCTECMFQKICQDVVTMSGDQSTNLSLKQSTTIEMWLSSNSTNFLSLYKICAQATETRMSKLNSSNRTKMVDTRILEVFCLLAMRWRRIQTFHSMSSNKKVPNWPSRSFNSKRDIAFWNTSLEDVNSIWQLQSILP